MSYHTVSWCKQMIPTSDDVDAVNDNGVVLRVAIRIQIQRYIFEYI